MKNDKKPGELLKRATLLITRLITIARTPKDFGTGLFLYPSEIHIIEAIGNKPGINVTELAAVLEISKPAVSKFVKKLESKNLIKRSSKAANGREVIFQLLPTGQEIFRKQIDYHSRADADIMQLMEKMSDKDLKTVEKLLDIIEVYAEKLSDLSG